MIIGTNLTKIVLALALAAVSCPASILYSNTTMDQQFSAFFSTGYTEIGDQLQLTSPGALASLDAQFFNEGDDATFDAIVQFYNVDSPVGTEIGGPFTVMNIFIASNTSQTVTFPDLGNLLVPQDVIVTLSVQNVSAGGDIGVNFFDPPAVGTSSNTFFIANDGMSFSQASTNMDIDNFYFEIDGAAVPEPGTTVAVAAALLLIGFKASRAPRFESRRFSLKG